jgi:hypothetical protein
MIRIQAVDDQTFEVIVDGSTTTTHTVTVSSAYHDKLTGGRVSREALIRRSFDFLLERESSTSILSAFDLPVIGRYFPEYEDTIRKQIA